MGTETQPRRKVLLFACEGVDDKAWRGELQALPPEIEVRFWPNGGAPTDVDYGFAWGNPPGFWRRFPNLQAVFSLGAGVDHLLRDGDLPTGVAIIRMVDQTMAGEMGDFVRMCVTFHHRQMHEYAVQQDTATWRAICPPRNGERTIGVMGLGALGGRCAQDLVSAGYDVRGWARRPKALAGVQTFAGEAELGAFLSGAQILVCALPLTAQTENILCARLFAQLPRGACLVNVGRGRQLVEADLLAALETGQLAGATLDVFRIEPLPSDHPFWRHPRITVVPHAAAFTRPQTAIPALAENLRRAVGGAEMVGVVDRSLGY